MKKLMLIILAVATLLAACAPTMYGVPQESWDRMSEAERIEVIRVYEREQQGRRQAAEERARRVALEREQARVRQAALEMERRERIEAIHRGEGAYGELIRVRLQGGRIRIGGQHHRYEPLTFTIADGETRKIAVADSKGREVDLVVAYAAGAFTVEGIRFPYDRSWGRGMIYADTSTAGPLELRGVDVYIQVHNRSARFEREPHRLVVIREEPPVVVVRERQPPPPPIVARPQEAPKPPRIEVRPQEAPKPPPAVGREMEPVKPAPPVRPPAPPVADHAPRMVDIVLLSGEMKVRGERLKLERTSLRLAEGESRELAVKAGGEKGTITLHYRNGELIFDGSVRRGRDAVRLAFASEWKTGKVYRFALKGRMPLEQLEVKITGIEGK